MRIRSTTMIAMTAGVLTLIAGVAAGGGTAHAAARPAAPAVVASATGYVTGGQLNGVAATSAGNAWAVGATGGPSTSSTLSMHWNGSAWAETKASVPAGGNFNAVAAGGGGAWAVGSTGLLTQRTLILHWNGRTWS